jgi:hypothetical protein
MLSSCQDLGRLWQCQGKGLRGAEKQRLKAKLAKQQQKWKLAAQSLDTRGILAVDRRCSKELSPLRQKLYADRATRGCLKPVMRRMFDDLYNIPPIPSGNPFALTPHCAWYFMLLRCDADYATDRAAALTKHQRMRRQWLSKIKPGPDRQKRIAALNHICKAIISLRLHKYRRNPHGDLCLPKLRGKAPRPAPRPALRPAPRPAP